ncbi:MAG: KUP/HAK/KT family potassium transporter [Legionellaceae bacterium]|nr:KUP/HAK/KT family potassium transporter [Legionellaceae bacterium]
MHKKNPSYLALSALGVVFGDIGTSPLYALRETLGGLAVNLNDILGILSLIFWTLILIVSVKYLIVIFRADNDGEGGILALLALLQQNKSKHATLFYIIAIFGAGAIVGDGMITPAISVVGAIDGLRVILPSFEHLILPISSLILIGLFMAQSHGSGHIGAVFGPILLIWFLVIGILGIPPIVENPSILKAINPFYAVHFLLIMGAKGYFLLGGIFLVVTGGEALYADIGHFGKRPIRQSWFCVVLPCLVLNYFGQGALLLAHPEASANPFYLLAPHWFLFPLLIISALATIIASQAVISATFSLTKQAIALGICPKLPMIQTSKDYIGQIYIPQMNSILMCGSLFLVLWFQNVTAMSHAYGIAVNLSMLTVTLLVAYAARHIWHWTYWYTIPVFTIFISIDIIFFGANLHKVETGGWLPICIASLIAIIMFTWKMGLERLQTKLHQERLREAHVVPKAIPNGTHTTSTISSAIFITDVYDRNGSSFLHFLKLSTTIPDHIIIIDCVVQKKPYIHYSQKVVVDYSSKNICHITLHYGFMEHISIPTTLELASKKQCLPFNIEFDAVTYWVEILNVVASRNTRTLWFHWQEKLFAYLMRNYTANSNIEFYKLPPERTIAIGTYCFI